MQRFGKGVRIVVTEDDDDDYIFIQQAMRNADLGDYSMCRVSDGDELMAFLEKRSAEPAPRLDSTIIFLDLNMPRMDGRQALREIKSHPDFKRIPVIVLTTSANQEDIDASYQAGANAYAVKPPRFDEFQTIVRDLGQHWVKTVRLSGI